MRIITTSITDEAFAFLDKKKEGEKYGIGKVISGLAGAAKAREDLLEELRRTHPATPTRQSWEASGIRVD